MKRLLLSLLFLSIMSISCKKNDCKTCTVYVIYGAMGAIHHDTSLVNQTKCGDVLKDLEGQNGKYFDITVGNEKRRYTTQVRCK